MNVTAMSLRFNVSLSQSLEFCERPWSNARAAETQRPRRKPPGNQININNVLSFPW
jgi:hypothetical protein